MTAPLVELQQQFIREVARCIQVEWDRADLDLSFDVLELMSAMREAKPAGQAEHWTAMDFRLDSTGKFSFEYGYGIPPMAARTIAAWERRKGDSVALE